MLLWFIDVKPEVKCHTLTAVHISSLPAAAAASSSSWHRCRYNLKCWHTSCSEQEQTHLACLPDGSLGFYHPWIASNCPLFIHTQASVNTHLCGWHGTTPGNTSPASKRPQHLLAVMAAVAALIQLFIQWFFFIPLPELVTSLVQSLVFLLCQDGAMTIFRSNVS